MFLSASKRAQLQELASSDPAKAIEETRAILGRFYKEDFSKLPDVEKKQWGGILFLHAQLLQQSRSPDLLDETLYTLERLKELCSKEAHPYYWAIANRNIGILWSSFRFNDVERQRTAIIQAFENVLSALPREDYFTYWVDAQINLAYAYLLPGLHCNEFKAYTLLNTALSPFYGEGSEEIAAEKLPEGTGKSAIAEAKKVRDDLKKVFAVPENAFTKAMEEAYQQQACGSYKEASFNYTRAKGIIQVREGESPVAWALADNLRQVNFAAGLVSRAEAAFFKQETDDGEYHSDPVPFFTEDDEKIYSAQVEIFVDLFSTARNYNAAAELLAASAHRRGHLQSDPALFFAYNIKLGSLYLNCARYASSLRCYLSAASLYEQNPQAIQEPLGTVYDAIASLLMDHFRFYLPAKYYLQKSLALKPVSPSLLTYEDAALQLKFAR